MLLRHLDTPMVPQAYSPGPAAHAFRGEHLRPDLEGRRYIESSAVTFSMDAVGGALEARSTWVIATDSNGVLQVPFDRTLDTLPGRRKPRASLALRNAIQLVSINAPADTSSLDGCTVRLSLNREHGALTNFDIGPDTDTLDGYTVFPRIEVDGPSTMSPNDTADLTVRILDGYDQSFVRQPTKLFIESSGGYLPHTRVQTDEGHLVFRFVSLALLPGERVRIKIGWRNWPSAAEHTITVV